MSYTLGTSFIDSKVYKIDWLNVVTKSLFYWYLALLFCPGQMEVGNNRVNMRKRQVHALELLANRELDIV